MKFRNRMLRTALAVGLLALPALGASCSSNRTDDHGHGHGEEEYARGPHRGRMLEGEGLSLEVTIYESGVPPEFRVYPYTDEEPLSPTEVSLTMALRRLGGRVDRIGFAPAGDHLRGDAVVYEPHSFAASAEAVYDGKSYRWEYEQLEGRTRIADEAAAEAGIRTERAGEAVIEEKVTLKGTIIPNGDRLAHIHPRYAGLAKRVFKSPGDEVRAGEALAVIESNESLSDYVVESVLGGTVVERHLAAGEFVTNETRIFTVADLSTVWLDLIVYRPDLGRLRKGQRVLLDAGGESAEATLSYVSSIIDLHTQSYLARAVLPNADGRWKPGMIVSARVVVGENKVPVAIKAEALQSFRDWTVVFQKAGDLYEILPVTLGRRDGRLVEIVDGLPAGTEYVAEGSFVVKADVLKLGASHDH